MRLLFQYNILYLLFHLVMVFFFRSSFLEYPIPKGIAFIGEIGLSGELRTVSLFLLIFDVPTRYYNI